MTMYRKMTKSDRAEKITERRTMIKIAEILVLSLDDATRDNMLADLAESAESYPGLSADEKAMTRNLFDDISSMC